MMLVKIRTTVEHKFVELEHRKQYPFTILKFSVNEEYKSLLFYGDVDVEDISNDYITFRVNGRLNGRDLTTMKTVGSVMLYTIGGHTYEMNCD